MWKNSQLKNIAVDSAHLCNGANIESSFQNTKYVLFCLPFEQDMDFNPPNCSAAKSFLIIFILVSAHLFQM